MNSETLIKYIEFLKTECLRSQYDKFITDDEINQLKIEITRFIDNLKTSSHSKEIKNEIVNIDFNLEKENHNHSKDKWLTFIIGFQSKEFKKQRNRKQRFLKLYNDLDSTLFKIKTLI